MPAGNGFVEVARLLKTLGHPVRLKIVCGLLGEPANLSRIARELAVPVSTLAQHLAVLRATRVLEEQRRGVEVIFHVADARVPAILRSLCSSGTGRGRLPRWSWNKLCGDRVFAETEPLELRRRPRRLSARRRSSASSSGRQP